MKESQDIKTEANKLFLSACYDQAISSYDQALASCPNYLDYDVAVLRSNISACYLKLADWKAAVESATLSIERLDKILPSDPETSKGQNDSKEPQASPITQTKDDVVEISGDDAEAEEKELKRLQEQDEQRIKVSRLRSKVLMRRARAKSELGGWANLQGAAEDYQVLDKIQTLSTDDKRIVQRALRELPSRINEAKEKEMGEMMSKMKDVSTVFLLTSSMLTFLSKSQLGNGILKPFGLSTDNFNFVQDPKTGGYSMNFQS